MMISIRHVAGIEHADIRADKGICLIAARNYQGKSTILKMTAAALCGVAIPTTALKKKDAKAMVRRGAKGGQVIVTDENGTVEITYPSCDVTTDGTAPHASTLAVGRSDLTMLDERDRARALADLLETSPTKEDLAQAIKDLGIPEDLVAKVTDTAWGLVETHGWDGAAKMAQENGAKLKGRWEQITSENWGADKARDWGGAGAMTEADRAALVDIVAVAKSKVDAMVGSSAITAAERQQIEAEAARLIDLKVVADDAETALQAAAGALDAAKKERDALPGIMSGGNAICPCCKEAIFVRPDVACGGYRADKVEPTSSAEVKKRGENLAGADGKVARLKSEHDGATRTHLVAVGAFQRAEAAAQQLATLGPAADNSDHVAALTGARGALAAAEAKLAGFDAKAQADIINASIGRTLVVVEALRADGVRKTKLIKTLDGFNDTLRVHTDAAGWKAVTITPDLDIEYAATPLFLCSESEVWRCRAALRLAIAKIQGSPIVILDGADVLDNPGRNGLFKMLIKGGVPSLVAMTIDAPPGSDVDPKSLVPDLAKRGFGQSWWIEAGVTSAIGETKAEAA